VEFTDDQIKLVLATRGIDSADIDRLLEKDGTRELTEERVKLWVREAVDEREPVPQRAQAQQHDFAKRLAGGLAGSRSQWIDSKPESDDDPTAA
jgi:hypothetical protein